jgi:hypothetical protein
MLLRNPQDDGWGDSNRNTILGFLLKEGVSEMLENLRNNRLFALGYRIVAFVACLVGVLDTTGVFKGTFNGEMLLFYTTESNVLVVIMFGILIARTVIGIRREGVTGPSSYCERLTAIVALAITVTMMGFWFLLAPTFGDTSFLFSYLNLQIHMISALLMLFDYFFFAAPGKLKKQDPWFFALIPLAYFAQATVLGFSGVTYEVLAKDGGPAPRFPYFFINYDESGLWVFAYVIGMTIFFMALAYLLLWYDRRRARRQARKS